MIKAKIEDLWVCDRLALTYNLRQQGCSSFEAAIKTRANVGDRVRIDQLCAERSVFHSRWDAAVKVVLFTADEWRYLRGLGKAAQSVMAAARQIAE